MIEPADPAKSRFIVIQAVRWSGLALVLAGLMIVNGKLPLPEVAGYVMTVIGIVEALIVPTLLARMWKTPG